ncbi:hypothetical protein Tco_0360862 [Tanacetum coccineum]
MKEQAYNKDKDQDSKISKAKNSKTLLRGNQEFKDLALGEIVSLKILSRIRNHGLYLLNVVIGKPVQDNGSGLAKWVSFVVKEEWTVEVFDKPLIVECANV